MIAMGAASAVSLTHPVGPAVSHRTIGCDPAANRACGPTVVSGPLSLQPGPGLVLQTRRRPGYAGSEFDQQKSITRSEKRQQSVTQSPQRLLCLD